MLVTLEGEILEDNGPGFFFTNDGDSTLIGLEFDETGAVTARSTLFGAGAAIPTDCFLDSGPGLLGRGTAAAAGATTALVLDFTPVFFSIPVSSATLTL